jgi:hypothetical protein
MGLPGDRRGDGMSTDRAFAPDYHSSGLTALAKVVARLEEFGCRIERSGIVTGQGAHVVLREPPAPAVCPNPDQGWAEFHGAHVEWRTK